MIECTITTNTGLEARLAALFVQTASKFSSSVFVKLDNKKVNAKSLLGIISIGISSGHKITIIADGSDAEAAIAELRGFFATNR